MTDAPLISEVEVRIGGTPLDVTIASHLIEVRVESHLTLPDMFSMRLADAKLEHVDDAHFSIGANVEVRFRAPDQKVLTSVFKGQITALEPEFAAGEAILALRGYDSSHGLNRTRRTETYQQMSVSDIARKVISRGGLKPEVDAATDVRAFVQQSNETDLAFLWRLAQSVGFEVVVVGDTLHFRRAGVTAGAPVELHWGRGLHSFRPRVTGARQVAEVTVRGWDPVAGQSIVGTARTPAVAHAFGVQRAAVVSGLAGGTVTVSDRPVGNAAEATSLAQAIAGDLAAGFVEADGLNDGDPRLRAGTKVKIGGIGNRFGGTYMLSEASHVFVSGRGYHTRLRITGRRQNTITGLSSATEHTGWHHSVVVGVVTNNRDPAGLGRVRVKYPALDENHEGWWARMTAPAAGANRGLLMLPHIGDEVVIAFEHDDDQHPYVLGAVWNARGKPEELAQVDGSFALRSTEKLTAQAVQAITVKGDAGVALEAGADMSLKATSALKGEAGTSASLEANQSLTLKGAQSVTVQGGQGVTVQSGAQTKVSAGAQLALESAGPVQIRGAVIQIEATGLVQIVAPQIMLG
ncbi:MAG: VgrG-related protein [Solirubrobacteraceae bacterium]